MAKSQRYCDEWLETARSIFSDLARGDRIVIDAGGLAATAMKDADTIMEHWEAMLPEDTSSWDAEALRVKAIIEGGGDAPG